MRAVERILIKLVIVQFIFLFLSQFLFHQMDIFPQIKQLTKYEGVNENTLTEIMQTFMGKESPRQ
ncbi:YpfB family protein [Neobacillus drentensis]|uniref:YpfB family protein n=1 Tax=Neobacillus drentensis TaxID=220684 RepID=UPI002FFFFC03